MRHMVRITQYQTDAILIGFDSAWTDKKRGAICAITFDGRGKAAFIRPELVSFKQAIEFIDEKRQGFSLCLVALDQPTIVPNERGSRPVERVVAAMISYVGGGVQPSYRSKTAMFGADAPVWSFKHKLSAREAPEESRLSQSGLFLMEVFPALALTGIHIPFAQRLGGPKYNPQNNKKFRLCDWRVVAKAVAEVARNLGVAELSDWASELSQNQCPRKSDQDQLDSTICALVGLIWRACDRSMSAMIGDTQTGYIVTPVSTATWSRLEKAASSKGVPIA